jgi:hypothetical protein
VVSNKILKIIHRDLNPILIDSLTCASGGVNQPLSKGLFDNSTCILEKKIKIYISDFYIFN